MEIGVCINMYPAPNGPEQTGVENLDLYRDAGFDYLELPGGALMHQPPEVRRKLEKRILASGVPCRAISSLFHPSIRLTGEQVDRQTVDDYIDGVISLAARLGVGTVVFGSSGARNVPMNFPYEKAWEQLADMLRRLGDRAAKDGVMVTIEHINRLEGNIIVPFAEGVKMAEQVNHPHVRCLIDYFHLALGNESTDLLREKFPLVKHAHVANVLARTIPIESRHEQGVVDYMTLLGELGYKGGVSVEGFTTNPAEFAQSAAFLRRFIHKA